LRRRIRILTCFTIARLIAVSPLPKVPCNVGEAFRAGGCEVSTRRQLYKLLFDEVKLKENAGSQELWPGAFPLDKLSGRRRIAQFSWIKKVK
jgi:hypothetical protein